MLAGPSRSRRLPPESTPGGNRAGVLSRRSPAGGDRVVPVDALEHSFTVLDRWLLSVLTEHGAMTAEAFANEPDARAVGSKDGTLLGPDQVDGWLDSARRRGLLEHYAVDFPG